MVRIESRENIPPIAGASPDIESKPARREILRSRLDTVVIAPKTKWVERYYSLPRLARTDIRYTPEGDIFHTRYRSREVPPPEEADNYRVIIPRTTRIGPQPVSHEDYIRQLALGESLKHRKYVEELVVMQITDDGGSVEAAIRAQEHILDRYLTPEAKKGERGERVRRAREVMETVMDLYNLLGEDEFNQRRARRLTRELIRTYRLERAQAKFTQELTQQLILASRGLDSLARFNPTITASRLGSVFIKAMREEEKADLVRSKFMANLVALEDERRVSRAMMELVAIEVGSKAKLAGHDSLLRPEHGITPTQVRIIREKVKILCRGLDRINLKPYRPVAVMAIDELQYFNKLLGRRALREIKKEGILAQVHREIRAVLDQYRDIYPSGSPA